MLMNDSEIEQRLNSPDNLINRLRSRLNGGFTGLELVTQTSKDNAVAELVDKSSSAGIDFPDVTDLVENADDKIRASLIQTTASEVLIDTLENLKYRLGEADNPTQLSKIAADMSKVIASIKQSTKVDNNLNVNQQVIIYKPVMHTEAHYDAIQVSE